MALALCATSCSVSRQATSSHSEQVKTERVETVEKTDSVIVEQRDTLREVTTITIDRNRRTSERRGQAGLDYPEREGGKPKVNDRGDTLKLVQITDLTRARSRDNVVAQKVKTEIVRDTVYIEKTDSVFVQNTNGFGGLTTGLTNPTNKKNTFVSSLKWIFWILVAGGLVIVVLRFGRLLKC